MKYFKIYRLRTIIKDKKFSKSKIKSLFDNFVSKRNIDVQDFLRKKAIKAEEENSARTYIMLNEKEKIIRAYVSVVTTPLKLGKLSKAQQKKWSHSSTKTEVDGLLIGQISKNDNDYNQLTPKELWEGMVYEIASQINELAPIKVLFLDCEDKMVEKYEKRGFTLLYKSESKKDGNNLNVMAMKVKFE